MPTSAGVPLIDISPFVDEDRYDEPARAAVAKSWDAAMSTVGFAIICGHGVSSTTVESLLEGAKAFFAQSESAKLAFNFGPLGNPHGGYTALSKQSIGSTRSAHGTDGGGDASRARAALPDLVESYKFRPDSPKEKPASLEAPCAAYRGEMLRVLTCLHRLTAAALGLPRDFFDAYYSPCAQTDMKISHYPPLPQEAHDSGAMRFGEHTDFTGYTLLLQDASDVGDLEAGGLQVRLPSGEWHAVAPVAGTFVINIGDLYEIWTNGRWRSTVHRVAKPMAGSPAAAAARLSVAFFTGPHNDAIISAMPTCVDEQHPAKYEPVRALDHLRRKLGLSNA